MIMELQNIKLGDYFDIAWGNTSITKKSYAPSGFVAFSATGADGFLKHFEHDEQGIILSAIGARCGKCFLASGKWTAIKNTIVITPKKEKLVDCRYAWYFLNDENKWRSKGAGQPFITQERALNTELPVPLKNGKPDLAEQKRIADKLDKVFAEIEKSIDKTRHSKKYAGKTVYSELLATFNDENLKTYPLDEVCQTTSGGTPSRSIRSYYDGDISWLKSGELNDNRSISSSEEHITEDAIRKSNAKIMPAGTVLIAMYGATVGKLGILSVSASTNQAVCAITPYKNILNEYMYWYLYFYRSELVSQAFGGAQPNISQTLIRKVPVKIPVKDGQPDLVKQKEIVSKVNTAQEKQQRLMDLLSIQEKLFSSLRSSVLSKSLQMQT